jgi:exopolysaccharide biosynthesis protein
MADKRTVIDSEVTYGKDDFVIESEIIKKEKISEKKGKNGKKKNIRKRVVIALAVILCLLVVFYLLFAFANFYPFRQLREIYIETAMTTDEHQWLAEWFFPKSVIDKVMIKKVDPFNEINEADVNIAAEEGVKDILGQSHLKVGDLDYAGNEILINDIEQGIMVSKVTGEGFVGKIMLIDDPSRVFLAVSPYWGSRGLVMVDMLEHYDAIAGINASGFADPGGHGSGEKANSGCRSQGENWGRYRYDQLTFGFNNENKLILGTISPDEWDSYNLRDCCQFGPALVVDGEQKVFDSAGYGLHPRSVIGQREDGVVLLLIVDGRQVGYSLGATLGQCAEIMVDYKAVSAAANDGGSSAVLGYDGAIITTPSTSSLRSTGRYLPDAWLVKRK